MKHRLTSILLLFFVLMMPLAGVLTTTVYPETQTAVAKKNHHHVGTNANKHGHSKTKHKSKGKLAAATPTPAPEATKEPRAKGKHHKGSGKGEETGLLIAEPTAEVTPVPDAATPEPKLTKKERRAAQQEQSAAVSAAAFTSPPPAASQPARMIRYFGAADGGPGPGNGAFFPWQFSNNFGKIEDAQRDVNGKSSHWVITDCAAFCGWDIYNFRVAGGLPTADPNWAKFQVNRDTMVGYVQRDGGGPPAWLAQQGWVDSGIVSSHNTEKGWDSEPKEGHVYTKDFPAGMITIPGPGSGKILPWILFAEKSGARPTMPSGYTPNETCSDAVHNKYKSRDGYPTWHLPYDPESWCYYRHSHGSDPSIVFGNDTAANMPNYGQISRLMLQEMPTAHGGNEESHFGHKGIAITQWPEAKYYLTVHFGTTIKDDGTFGRFNTCLQRFHLLEIAGRDNQGRLVIKERFMADFGESVGVAKGGDNPADDYSINPPGCPNGNAQAAAEGQQQPGVRRIGIGLFHIDPNNPLGLSYEPWRCAGRYALTLGILNGCPVFNTPDNLDSIRSATDFTIQKAMNRSGTAMFFTINQVRFTCPDLPASKRTADGKWYTDPMATVVYDLNNRPSYAVQQFCLPGWAGSPVRAAGTDAAAHLGGFEMNRWGMAARPTPGGEPGDFERSITDSHGPN